MTSILVLVAGTNSPSNSDCLADYFIDGLKESGCTEITKIYVRDLNLHHFTLDDYDLTKKTCEPEMLMLRDRVMNAAGVVIATPIWNFSVPSHLKNLIDRMGAFGLDQETHSKGQLNGKPFALIYTGGAPMIAWQALMYLTTLHVAEAIKYYGGTIMHRHFEPKCVPGRGKFGLVVDQRPQSLEHMKERGMIFGKAAKIYAETGKLPLGRSIWHKWFSFLYRVGNRIMYPISSMQ